MAGPNTASAPASSQILSPHKVESLDRELETALNRLREYEQLMLQLEAELSSRAEAAEKAIAEMRDRVNRPEIAFAQRQPEEEQLAAELAAARTELRQMAADQAENDKILAGYKEHIWLLVGDVSDREKALRALEQAHSSALREKEHALREKEEALRQNDHALRQKDDALRQKDDALRQKHDALRQKHDALRQKDDALRQKDDALRQKGDALRQKDDALRQKDELLITVQQQLKQLAAKASAQAQELAGVKREAEEKAAQAEKQVSRMAEMAVRGVARAIARLIEAYGGRVLWGRFRLERQIRLFRRSGLLDTQWYAQHYTDVARAGADPLRHYVEYGAKEGRVPNPSFLDMNSRAEGEIGN